ncbi:hypothetical protein [Myroides marinus]|uniref:hypothetical protein n=1 Tax=Myroides marinus TaxID=703342 RepID=UPI002576C704|nr:hypothetical protein [Myroides marinus]MDM1346505.1 hypothetical protein [Myroides marinus]MDM1349924.1 hypothetical protein [Myroides marinus]
MCKTKRVIISNLGRVITKLGYMDKEYEKLYNKGGNEEVEPPRHSHLSEGCTEDGVLGTIPEEVEPPRL